jgi:hypothetical protein
MADDHDVAPQATSASGRTRELKALALGVPSSGSINRAQHVGLRLHVNAAADRAEFEWECYIEL